MRDLDLDVPTLERDEAEPASSQLGIRRGATETLFFRGLGLPLSFAISIVTSRFLQPTGRGAYVLGLLTVTIAATLLGNISAGVTHEIGARVEAQRTIVAQAIIVTLVLGVVGVAVLLPIDLVFADQDYRTVVLAVFALPAMLVTQAVTGGLLALGRLRQWNLLQLFLPTATLGAMLVFVVVLGKAVTGAAVSWALAQGLVCLGALLISRDLWWPFPNDVWSMHFVRPMLNLGIRLGVVNALSLVNYRIELVILETYRGLHPVGIYSLAVSLGELLWLVSASLSTATVTRAVQADDHDAAEVIARGVRHALLLTAIFGVALVAVAEPAIPFIFGSRFAGSRMPLLILVPGIIAFAPASVLAVFFSLRIGRARYAFVLAAVSATTTALMAVILIPRFGEAGAAASSTGGYVLSVLCAFAWFLRLTGLPVSSLVPGLAELRAYRSLALAILHR